MTCQTIYPSRVGISHVNLIALSIMNTVSGLGNISINILLVYSLWKLDLIKNTSYKFIACLCIADGCVGLVTQPAVSFLLLSEDRGNNCIHEMATHSLQIALCQFSVLMILIITVDRFLRMTYLTKYKSVMTQNRGRALMIISIFTTCIFVLLNIIATIFELHFVVHTTITIINVILFVIIMMVYSKTYMAIRTRVHDSHLSKTPPPNAGSVISRIDSLQYSKSKIQYHQNFGKAMIFVLMALMVCYLPYFVLITHLSYLRFKTRVMISNRDWRIPLLYWLMQLTFINSTANAVIVLFSSKQLRGFARSCLKTRRGQNTTTPHSQEAKNQTIPINE